MRKVGYTVHNSLIKGAYHKHGNVISDKCFGDWMDIKRPQIVETWEKLNHGDFWAVSHSQVKDLAFSVWDDLFLNIQNCEDYHWYYNNYTWCLNNIGDCYYGDSVLGNIVAHGFELVYPVADLWNMLAVEDWICDSDTVTLNKLDRTITALSSIWAYIHGFDAEWNNFEEIP